MLVISLLVVLLFSSAVIADSDRYLELSVMLDELGVEREFEGSRYSRGDYPYRGDAEFENLIVLRQGGLYGPYEMECFGSIRDSDIEHLVAMKEAHRSGAWRFSANRKAFFAQDLLNLVLASPYVNRELKKAYDPKDWLPEFNVGFYIASWIEVKHKYGLAVDVGEKRILRMELDRRRDFNFRLEIPECVAL